MPHFQQPVYFENGIVQLSGLRCSENRASVLLLLLCVWRFYWIIDRSRLCARQLSRAARTRMKPLATACVQPGSVQLLMVNTSRVSTAFACDVFYRNSLHMLSKISLTEPPPVPDVSTMDTVSRTRPGTTVWNRRVYCT